MRKLSGCLSSQACSSGRWAARPAASSTEQEFELLAQPTLDDDVVALQAHGHRLARGNLFLHVLVDQTLQLESFGGGARCAGSRRPGSRRRRA